MWRSRAAFVVFAVRSSARSSASPTLPSDAAPLASIASNARLSRSADSSGLADSCRFAASASRSPTLTTSVALSSRGVRLARTRTDGRIRAGAWYAADVRVRMPASVIAVQRSGGVRIIYRLTPGDEVCRYRTVGGVNTHRRAPRGECTQAPGVDDREKFTQRLRGGDSRPKVKPIVNTQ
eukprot:2218355-Prymnesium_polylepis.1